VIGATTALALLHEECLAALGGDSPEVVSAAAARATMALHRKAIARKFAEIVETTIIHRSAKLTMLVVPSPPGFWSWPHEHSGWAVAAMLQGAEEHVVFDRHDHGIVERRRFRIDEGIGAALPAHVVHAAGNDGDAVSLGLHILEGDPFGEPRMEWDPGTGQSRTVDGVSMQRRHTAMTRA